MFEMFSSFNSGEAPILENLLDLYQFLLPAFYKLNIKEHVIYKQSIDINYLISSVAYAVIYCIVIVLISIKIFEKKNLD